MDKIKNQHISFDLDLSNFYEYKYYVFSNFLSMWHKMGEMAEFITLALRSTTIRRLQYTCTVQYVSHVICKQSKHVHVAQINKIVIHCKACAVFQVGSQT